MQLSTGSGGNIEAIETFCVHTTGGARFNLRANSLHGNGAFTLRGNAGIDSVNYQIYARKNTPPTGPEIQLQEGSIHTANQWAGHLQDGCNSGANNNMRIRVHIPQSELTGLEDSTYTDTVTLTVEPL